MGVVNGIAEEAHDAIDKMVASKAFSKFVAKMKRASLNMGEGYSVEFHFQMSIGSIERDASLPIVRKPVVCVDGEGMFDLGRDSFLRRYWVNGNIKTAPLHYCPHCWKDWDDKVGCKKCAHCGVEMGKQVRFLVDDDACPHCKSGKISRTKPACGACKKRFDPSDVIWG